MAAIDLVASGITCEEVAAVGKWSDVTAEV